MLKYDGFKSIVEFKEQCAEKREMNLIMEK